MNVNILFRHVVALMGVATLLAGCSSAGSSPGLASGLVPDGLNPAGAREHIHPHRLWAAPDIARIRRLLFVSDDENLTVNIYSLPDLTLKGQVGGFNTYIEVLYGECADRSGNIWVTGDGPYGFGMLTKLARDGTVLSSLNTSYGPPNSCAVDPTTGNLAVTENSYYSAYGAVVIYAGGSGRGTVIKNPKQTWYAWDGYDTRGNLWEDGNNGKGASIISRCGASSCRTIPISGGKIKAGWLQYAIGEKTWYVGSRCDNANAYCIYPVSASGVLGKPITLTDPQGRRVGMFQGVISNGRSRVLAGSAIYGKTHDVVALWNFPAGGSWTDYTSDYGRGAAISQK